MPLNLPYGGSGPWKSTFTKESTTLFKQITGGYFLYQHVENYILFQYIYIVCGLWFIITCYAGGRLPRTIKYLNEGQNSSKEIWR